MPLNVGANTYPGQLTADGALGVLAGSSLALSTPRLILLLKAATNATNATFSGTYCTLCFGFDDVVDEFSGAIGTIVADGNGGTTYSLRGHTGSGLGAPVSRAEAYEVAPDGALEYIFTGVSQQALLRGAVSADGAYAILWGSNEDGARPQSYLLFRQ